MPFSPRSSLLPAVCVLSIHFVRDVLSASGDYVGCFADQRESRLLGDFEQLSNNNLTTDSCVDFCSKEGYAFAGTEQGSDCYCGNNRPPNIASRLASECSIPCSGYRELMCGGNLRLSIYETNVSAVGFPPSAFYIGCFAEDLQKDSRKLLHDLNKKIDNLTPQFCSEYCFKKGFILFGLQNGTVCYCTNKKSVTKKNPLVEGTCSVPCQGDASKKCGGTQEVVVYATGLTELPANTGYIGCFEDPVDENSPLGLETEFRANFQGALTHELCMNVCYQMGYKFFGLKGGFECVCGMLKPLDENRRPAKECHEHCAGQITCLQGGNERIMFHTTPLADIPQEKEPVKYLGCYHIQNENRLFDGTGHRLNGMTPTMCTETCYNQGYTFAGINGSSECLCGHSRPPALALRFDSECSIPCSGDPKLKCGGVYSLRVFTTGISAVGTLPHGFHLGCFTNNFRNISKTPPDLRITVKNITPKSCFEFCFKMAYQFAGVHGKSCTCTNKKFSSKWKTGDEECQTLCEGDISKKCGGAKQMNVYATGLPDKPATGRLFGCYRTVSIKMNDNAVTDINTFLMDMHERSSPRLCFNTCYQMGFKFAGIQSGIHCVCGVHGPLQRGMKPDSECESQTCSGDPAEECGETKTRIFYKTPLQEEEEKEAEEYIGCYSVGRKNGLLDDLQNGNSKLTPSLCTGLCFKGGYPFAGLQGTKCFCGYSRPPLNAKGPESECSTPCGGDQKLKCGSDSWLSIHKTGVTSRGSMPSGHYMGCFSQEDTKTNPGQTTRITFDAKQKFQELNPKTCNEHCFKIGFKWSGLQKQTCFCTNKELNLSKPISEDECSLPCDADISKTCGGPTSMDVYATGLTDIPATGRLIGCFEDDGQVFQVEPNFKGNLLTSNSPQACINICYQMGFKFAGLRQGYQCFCEKSKPAMEKAKPDTECDIPCTGDSRQICGGKNRQHFYKTPLADPSGKVEEPDTQILTELSASRGTEVRTGKPSTTLSPSASATPTPSGKCRQRSTTIVNGKPACRNSVVFRDNFRQLNLSRWTHEIKIASKPDYEFTVFDSKPENIFIRGGALHIQPTVYDDKFVQTGTINLEGRCTGEIYNDECSRNTENHILPPTQSARITTKESFTFKYGVVDIQAKLPVGDWIIAEMWLVPAESTYGVEYGSGKIKMMSRGNPSLLYDDGSEMGSQTVEGSVILGFGDQVKSRSVNFTQSSGWHSKFHNFSIIWTPGDIAFSIDGKRRRNIMVNSHGARLNDVMGFPSSRVHSWDKGTTIAPFDQPFYISLGLSVGGLRDFQNNAVSNGYPKPWSNTDPQAAYKFWNKRNEWQRTWQGDTAFQIKSIKVTAL